MRLILAACLLAGFSSHALAVNSDGTKPDDTLTPGEIRTTDRAEICGHTTKEFRDVSVTTKIAARRAYGLKSATDGWCANGCEVDHRIPLVVGGDNKPSSIKNLWPQASPIYHRKDICEEKVGRALCAGTISVTDAQAIFLGDWTVGCAPYLNAGDH